MSDDHLTFPFPDPPAPGQTVPIAPGLLWIRMPLPFALDHINLWALDGEGGWTLVDTGIDNQPTRDLWDVLLKGPLAGRPIKQLICTHYHPDHMGLAGWLTERLGIPFYATEKEWARAKRVHALTTQAFVAGLVAMGKESGLSPDLIAMLESRKGSYADLARTLPAKHNLLDPLEPVLAAGTEWRVVIGEGHSPELAALYAAGPKVLISGDQVLPKITPNVSIHPDAREVNPLAQFMESLERFRPLAPNTLVLPSHRLPFVGLHVRLDQLAAHHHERLQRALEVCADWVSAAIVMKALFPRKLDAHQLGFALGETQAHIAYLVERGDLAHETREGVRYYKKK